MCAAVREIVCVCVCARDREKERDPSLPLTHTLHIRTHTFKDLVPSEVLPLDAPPRARRALVEHRRAHLGGRGMGDEECGFTIA